ncbi:MAG: hypothetical protein LM632_00890 [Armatimonadetes bacterium]|nr:hypothetical protein [Armatimonadota bacterium]
MNLWKRMLIWLIVIIVGTTTVIGIGLLVQDYLNMRYTQWVRRFEQCCDEEEIVPQRPTEPTQKPAKSEQKPSTR